MDMVHDGMEGDVGVEAYDVEVYDVGGYGVVVCGAEGYVDYQSDEVGLGDVRLH